MAGLDLTAAENDCTALAAKEGLMFPRRGDDVGKGGDGAVKDAACDGGCDVEREPRNAVSGGPGKGGKDWPIVPGLSSSL